MEATSESFGPTLRTFRERACLTQEQLAERAALSPNAISALERGARRRPYPRTVRALAGALGLSTEERAELEGSVSRPTVRQRRSPRPSTRSEGPADLPSSGKYSAAEGPPTPRQLPAVTRNFTGRMTDLAILDALLPDPGHGPERTFDESTSVISTISGTAGVGKTTLALAWAHRVKSRFPAGQLYVNLRGYDPGPPARPDDVLERFLRALNVTADTIPPGVEERAALFRSVVAGRRLLVVLDNAISAEQVRPLLPGSSSCLVVVTSRVDLSGLAISVGAVRIALDVLPIAEAGALLRTIIGPGRADAEPSAVAELAELCARLPLALKLAGQRAATRPHLRIADLVGELAAETGRLDVLSAGADEFTDVRPVFSWSFQSLPEPQARMFRLLGLHPGADIGHHAAAALADVAPAEARRLIDGLADAHLVEHVGRDRCQLHDLLRDYARERVAAVHPLEERLLANRRLVGFYLHGAAAASHLLHPGRDRTGVDGAPPPEHPAPLGDYDEALDWCEAERANLVAVTGLAAESGMDTAAWQLPMNLWSFYYIRKHRADWMAVSRIGFDAATRSGHLCGQARMLSSLAAVHRDLHRFDEAIDHYQRALELRRALRDRPGEASCLSNLGDAYLGLRQYAKAVDNSRRALAIVRQLDDPYSEAIALGNLSEAYLGLHRYEEALVSFGHVLELCQKISHRYGESLTLIHLGEAYLGLHRHEDAIDHLTQAVELCRDIGNTHGEGVAWRTIGQVHAATGRPDLADRCWETAHEIFRALGGPEAEEVRC